jgi:hypothetical protein
MTVACGGGDKPATSPPTPVASAAPTAPAADTSAPATPPAAGADAGAADAASSPLATILTTDPGALAKMTSAVGTAPAAKLSTMPAAPAGDALVKGVREIGGKASTGFTPDGQMASGDLKEGEHQSMEVKLSPGKCYAIVGFSPKGQIQDLDLRLFAPPFFNILSGEDLTDDNSPVIGRAPSPMCPVVPVDLAYKVDIYAEKGTGKFAVQMFSKAAK